MFNHREGSSINVNGNGSCILIVGFQVLSSTISIGRIENGILENVKKKLLRTVERIRIAFL